MKKWAFITALLLEGIVHSQSSTSVVPQGLQNQNGNSGYFLFSGSVNDYQQLFRASMLPVQLQAPVEITSLALRVDGGAAGSFDAIIPKVEIHFSTTSQTPEQMSSDFAQNKGSDDLIVYNHDNVPLFGSIGQPVNTFDIRFAFDTPFVYDASKGNLLMYIKTGASLSPGARSLDAHEYTTLDSNSPYAAFGNGLLVPQAFGLVTEFQYTTIPEPTGTALLALGFVSIFANVRDRKEKN